MIHGLPKYNLVSNKLESLSLSMDSIHLKVMNSIAVEATIVTRTPFTFKSSKAATAFFLFPVKIMIGALTPIFRISKANRAPASFGELSCSRVISEIILKCMPVSECLFFAQIDLR